jgi:hypothetical protein
VTIRTTSWSLALALVAVVPVACERWKKIPPPPTAREVREATRVALTWDTVANAVVRHVDDVAVADDAGIERELSKRVAARQARGQPPGVVVIDALGRSRGPPSSP